MAMQSAISQQPDLRDSSEVSGFILKSWLPRLSLGTVGLSMTSWSALANFDVVSCSTCDDGHIVLALLSFPRFNQRDGSFWRGFFPLKLLWRGPFTPMVFLGTWKDNRVSTDGDWFGRRQWMGTRASGGRMCSEEGVRARQRSGRSHVGVFNREE